MKRCHTIAQIVIKKAKNILFSTIISANKIAKNDIKEKVILDMSLFSSINKSISKKTKYLK